MSPISIPGKVTLQKQYSTVVSDPDATAYLQAVEAADGQTLEIGIAQAVNDFVVGCKADGIWDAIKASCILAGARTLSGALVPLKGTAPTNNNFVSGDYNRETGLVGDGSTKYLDSNRANNADPQNSKHIVIYGTAGSRDSTFISTPSVNVGGDSYLYSNASQTSQTVNINGTAVSMPAGNAWTTGFLGASRANSLQIIVRRNGLIETLTTTSTTPINENLHVFGSGSLLTQNARLSFYSIGESIDLALLDNRVSTLMTDIGAAIP